MDLWKPAVRKAKKVSSSSSSSSRRRNHGNGGDKCDWAGGLPDVVADLTLAETHLPAMLGTRDHHYLDMGEPRARRREARPPPPPVTPQGLGAAPQGLGAAPSPPMVGGGSGVGGGGGWRHNPQHAWPSQPPMDPSGGAPMMPVGVGCGGLVGVPGDGEGARVRSASSEPRGPAGNGVDRRVRCSSATRSHQHRPRPPPGERPSANASVPPLASLPPAGGGGGHGGGQQPYSPAGGSSSQPASMGAVGGVLARLPGCYDGLESGGREAGEGVAYGYQVSDLEALLTRASPSRPANLPMVLASATRLHNMRRTLEPHPQNQQPVRPFLPLGIIVNAVFKTRDWLYVRTAHGAEGYVPYRVCLPLGILPPPREGHGSSSSSSPGVADAGVGVWESRSDVFQGATPLMVAAAAAAASPNAASSAGVGGGGGGGGEPGGQTRGRPRGRRRPHCLVVDSSNQTDTQKLQPGGRSVSETRSPRESLVEPPAVAPASTPPVAATPTADHVLV